MEPRATRPEGRLAAIAELSAAGVPVTALVAPIIPGLNDHEVPAILKAVRAAGAVHASYVLLRLPHGVGELFEAWVQQHFPQKKDKIMRRVRDMRGGKLYDSRWSVRQRGEGAIADLVRQVFETTYRREKFAGRPELSAEAFQRPGKTPLRLFD
jgi:DNA repair photolyase